MKLVEINWNPTDRQLRQFGWISLFGLPAVGWLWGAAATMVGILGVVGVAVVLTGMFAPQTLKPIFLLLTLVALPIGLIVSELATLLIYFGFFVPLGVAFRIVKRDSLRRQMGRERPTYWDAKKRPTNLTSYYHQS